MSSYQNLGTKLRHLVELLDTDVTSCYQSLGLTDYKPKYTPVFKALIENGASTIGVITEKAGISQPAISKTVREMTQVGLIQKVKAKDARESKIELTEAGKVMVPLLQNQWQATTQAAKKLDQELPNSLFKAIEEANIALNKQSFLERILIERSNEEDS